MKYISVPAVGKKTMRSRIILSLNDEDDYTFSKKFKNDKQFLIGNATIYPKNLKPIALNPGDTDVYIGGSAIDCYLLANILCFETKEFYRNVTIFPVEGYIINELRGIIRMIIFQDGTI